MASTMPASTYETHVPGVPMLLEMKNSITPSMARNLFAALSGPKCSACM
jgi:hypothetical protein